MNSINPVSPFNREMVTRYCVPAVRGVSVTAVTVIRPPLTVGTVPCVTAEEVNFTLVFSGTAIAGTDYIFRSSLRSSGGWEEHYCESSNPCDVPAGASSTEIGLILYDHDAVWDGSQTVIIDIDSVTNGTEDGTQQAEMTLNNDGQL